MTDPVPDAPISAAAMRPLRATAIVGVGSVITLGMSVITMKAYALLVGPQGVGLLALMQSVINIGVIVVGMGISTSVISALAPTVARDPLRASALTQGATALSVLGGAAGGLLLVGLREPVAAVALGSSSHAHDVLYLGPALILATVAGSLVAILTGRHLVRRVTAVNVSTAVFAAGFGIPVVALLRADGLALTVLATAGAQLSIARFAQVREAERAAWPLVKAHIGGLLRSGLPIAASQLAGSGTALLIPIVVVALLDQSAVGLYRAAAAISIGYLTFFVAGLHQDYLPRLAAARSPAIRTQMVEQRMRLVMGLAVPVIMALLALGPWVIQVLYTGEFADAFLVLRWQLLGDLLRLPAWVLSFVLLARQMGRTYFAVEALGGFALVGASMIGLLLGGLEGVGLGYLVAQAIYLTAVWLLVQRHVGTTPGRLQLVVAGLSVGSGAVIMLRLGSPAEPLIFIALAALAAAMAWPRLSRMRSEGLI